jgi:hypothetical protein
MQPQSFARSGANGSSSRMQSLAHFSSSSGQHSAGKQEDPAKEQHNSSSSSSSGDQHTRFNVQEEAKQVSTHSHDWN